LSLSEEKVKISLATSFASPKKRQKKQHKKLTCKFWTFSGMQSIMCYFTLKLKNESAAPSEMGSHFMPKPACTVILLFVLPGAAGMIGKHHHAQPLVDMGGGVSQTFCLDCPWTTSSLSSPLT
jgi:hypothetical protein